MSKELEALYSQIKERLANDDGKTHQTINLDISVSAMKEVLQALTPPTVEQLCEELGEFFEKAVKYISGMFYYGEDLQFTEICNTTIEDLNGNQLYDIYLSLPPRLLKRIAMFYENEVQE